MSSGFEVDEHVAWLMLEPLGSIQNVRLKRDFVTKDERSKDDLHFHDNQAKRN